MSSRKPRRVFVSYAREDRTRTRPVVDGLRLLGADVWVDEELTGGQQWWDAILERIRACDVFAQAVSPTSVDSEACMSERAYALALAKPVLPVLVAPVAAEVMPSDLAVLHMVDYREATAEEAFRLARALFTSAPAPPLPATLPAAPAVPGSYLSSISDRIRAPSLSIDEQLGLVSRLRDALARDDQREHALDLLRRLQRREDLFAAPDRQIERLLAAAGGLSATDGAPIDILAPELGTSITEITVVQWRKAAGDMVEADEVIADFSTDKVDGELPAPATGILLEILAGAGATVPAGQVIARMRQRA